MNTLIVDIGTSSMRGILFTEQGERLASCQVLYEPVKYPDGRIEQAPGDFSGAGSGREASDGYDYVAGSAECGDL